MVNILVLSEGHNCPTGFGSQATYFSDWMASKGHNVYHIGMNHVFQKRVTETGVTLLPIGDTNFGETVIGDYLKKYDIDILWTLLDVWMTEPIAKGGINYNGKDYPIKLGKTKWIGYFPIDTEDQITSQHMDIIHKMHIPVTISMNSNEKLKEWGIETSMIPHCVDTNIFKPLPQEEMDAHHSKQVSKLNDFFIVGMNGNNQLRKFNPYFFEAYSYFMKPNTKVLAHMDFNRDSSLFKADGWNLTPIIHNVLDIPAEHIISTGVSDGFAKKMEITPKQLARMYNMMKVHYSCGNEGWGCPMLEAAACGVPNISPHYTTAEQMIGSDQSRGRFCKTAAYWYNQKTGHRWVIPDAKDLAEQFEFYYRNPEEWKKASENARIWALQYDIAKIMPVWEKLIEETLNYRQDVNYFEGKWGI